MPLMKAREVIMYHKHLLRHVAILVGRCLTMLWGEVIKVSGAKELFAMSDILPFVRSAIQHEQSQTTQGRQNQTMMCISPLGTCTGPPGGRPHGSYARRSGVPHCLPREHQFAYSM